MTAPPLLFIAAAAGALAAFSSSISPTVAFVVVALAAAGAIFGRARFARAVFILLLAASAPFSLGRLTITQYDETTTELPDDTVVVEGIARAVSPRRDGGQKLTLDVSSFVDGDFTGARMPGLDVSLLGAAGLVSLAPGDRVRVRGHIRPYLTASQPGAFDARLFGISRGAHGRIAIGDRASIAVVEEGAESAFFARLARTLLVRLRELSTPHEAALVAALVTGDTSGFEPHELLMYRQAGAGHLLAVSGLQVSLLAALLFLISASLLTLVTPIADRGWSSTIATFVALLAVWAYVLLCGAPPSCVRAALMASAGLVAVLPGRRLRVQDTVSLAGFATLLVAPVAIVDAGFLLSYAAVIGLAVAATELPPEPTLVSRLKAVVVSSVGAGIVTLPVSAHLFGEVALGGVVANIVLVPAASLLQVPAIVGGLLGVALSSSFIVEIGAAAAGLLEALVEGMATLVGGVRLVEPPTGLMSIALTAAALALAIGLARRETGTLAVGFVTVAAVVVGPSLLSTTTTRVSFLPVGQGDSAVLEFADGTVMLVDGGGVWDERVDPGIDVVLPYLARRGIDRIDVVVLSHPDPDHLLGLLPVVRTKEVGEIWHSGIGRGHPLVRRLLDEASARNVPVRVARDLMGAHPFGDTVVEVLAPHPEDGTLTYRELSPNDNSLVLRVSRGASSILLAGDVERWGERYLLRDHSDLRATILKAGHHGSRTSSTEPFVDAVQPAHVMFTTGRGNAFGFPHADVVERYRSRDVCLWDTAVHGRVTFSLGLDAVTVSHTVLGAEPCVLGMATP
jgi:competence protein ComEC